LPPQVTGKDFLVLTTTRHTKRTSLRSRALLAVAAAAVVGAMAGSPMASATPLPSSAGSAQPGPIVSAPAAPTQGIIMRDGGVCDPIRHMGC
jgi:hypothetical protein